ncbi:MAG TPA: amino acid adenylation domain-containing protein, partial [Allocoleopsis sp.]
MTQATALQGFPLSPQQKRLWQLQSATSSSPYRVEAVIEIQGPLKLDRLRTALEQVVARHEILRTTFPMLPGMVLPLQVISDRPQIDLQVRAANLKRQTPQKPESTLCVTCIQHTPDYHQLHLNLSALWVDGVSLRQFVSELAQCYAGSPFNEDPLQYADIATWQNDLLDDPDSENARRYWQQLNLDTIAIQLPIANPNTTTQTPNFQPQIHSIPLNPELLAALQTQADYYHVPLKTLLLACWLVLLQRLTQAENLVVGVMSEGRHYDELATAIGPLTKTLPVTVAFDSEISFSTLLSQANAQAQTALDWQDVFDWSLLKLPTCQLKDTAYCPFSFAFMDGETVVSAADLSFKLQRLFTYCDRFSIQLTVTGSSLDFYFNTVEYSSSAIAQLANYFQTLLQSVVEQQDTAIQNLAILNERDRQHLLTLNQTTADYPSDHIIHQWFEAQIQQTPDAIAVISEQQSLTYAELNARSNQLAHYLQHQGVGAEVIVGLCLERSPELIIGLLAILKAGGAFLPLDPRWPDQQLRHITESASAALILTQQSLVPRWGDRDLLVLDQAITPWSEMPECNLGQTVNADNLAYVVYTSGSTGEPKGVAVEHRQLVNYVCGISDRLALPTGSHFGLVSTIAADLGYTMLFPALCTGGCLHLISSERATDPVAFADYCRHAPLDVLKLTPSHLAALLTSDRATDLLPRQRLLLGGEALPWTLIQQLRQLGATCQIWNHYGPTEATIGVLTAPVPECTDTTTVPLGQPLPNTQVYLLDEQQQPVPIGVAGEIYIGGAGVARGYLHQPQLTQEKFIANLFVAETSERLYRTGDRARYHADGSLEFLGRRDDQVKIRGFRVELGEIEAVLRQQTGVAQAVVVARSDAGEHLQLVGYVVTHTPENNLDKLQQALQTQLPVHMVPILVYLKTLPLLPNGKVDRQALPSPDTVHLDTPVYVAPRTSVEVTLAEIWSNLLGLSQVSIHDNFFALGGDSILSIQMIARAHQMGVRLTPKQIYQHPTIAELATVADTTATIRAAQGLVTGWVPLTPIQHWFFEQAVCDRHHWNQAVLLEPQVPLDLQVLQQAVQHLVQHHDVLRSRFQQTEQGWQEIIHDSVPEIPIQRIDLTALPTSE